MSNRAEELATLGYVIFPILPDEKRPLVKWSRESTCSLEVVREWWRDWPTDNVGINCGESGIVVIDLDSEGAARQFMSSWYRHEQDMPGLIVATRRGWHLYFESPIHGAIHNSAGRLGSGIDVRGQGGMVLAPGSVVRGTPYTVLRGTLEAVPPMPGWLYQKLAPKPPSLAQDRLKRSPKFVPRLPQAQAQLRQWCRKIITAPDGMQNNTINAAAHVLARDYSPPLDLDEVREELERAAEVGQHPVSRARPTIRSGLHVQWQGEDDGNRSHGPFPF